MQRNKGYAIFSVYNDDKNSSSFHRLLLSTVNQGYPLLASGGTYKFIKETMQLDVTDVSEITGVKPVLGHRVVTLAEEIHGGLLADEILHLKELEHLGWPMIDIAVCTFYPLERTIHGVLQKYREKMSDPEQRKLAEQEINDMVDIGGPTMMRSACKGGRVAVASSKNFSHLSDLLEAPDFTRFSDHDKLVFQADASRVVADYVEVEAKFRSDRLT